MAEEIRQITNFKRVVLRNWGKLVLRKGDIESLLIEADEEFLSKVSTTVEDGTLELRSGRKLLDVAKSTFETSLSRQNVVYHLTFRKLEALEVPGAAKVDAEGISGGKFSLNFAGAGDVAIRSIEVRQLEIEMPGAGKLEIEGTTDEQYVMLSGAGSYVAANLTCRVADIELHGVGKARVHVTERLDASIKGLGSIEYSGQPEVNKSVKGLGSVYSSESE